MELEPHVELFDLRTSAERRAEHVHALAERRRRQSARQRQSVYHPSTMSEPGVCTRVHFGNAPLVQPCHQLECGTPTRGVVTFTVCQACTTATFVPGCATPSPTLPLRSFVCEGEAAAREVPGITAFGEYIFAPRTAGGAEVVAQGTAAYNDAALSIHDAALAQQARLTPTWAAGGGGGALMRRLQSSARHVLVYESPELQQQARACVDMGKVQGYREEILQKVRRGWGWGWGWGGSGGGGEVGVGMGDAPHRATALRRTTPHHAAPRHTTPHHAAPHHTTPHHTTPRRTTPHHAAPRRTTPHHAAPRRATPHHNDPTPPHRTPPTPSLALTLIPTLTLTLGRLCGS